MLGWRVWAVLCALVSTLGCASSAPRETAAAPEAAPAPVGWVEFLVDDTEIPQDPRLAGSAERPACKLNVLLDDRSVVSTTLRPTGHQPPYALSFRFRIRALPGGYVATFRYAGCADDPRRNPQVVADAPLLVLAEGVTQVRFDGALVTTRPPALRSGPAHLAN